MGLGSQPCSRRLRDPGLEQPECGAVVSVREFVATSLDMQGLDGIIFDGKHKTFKMGSAPFYVQIKCRGSSTTRFNPQGRSPKTIDKIRKTAKQLGVPITSVYLVLGFYKDNDIRSIQCFAIPFGQLSGFNTGGQYRFSVTRCTTLCASIKGMFRL